MIAWIQCGIAALGRSSGSPLAHCQHWLGWVQVGWLGTYREIREVAEEEGVRVGLSER